MAAVLVLRVLGLVVGGAALVIGLAAGAIYFISTTRLNQKVVIPTESVAIPTDITAIQRGQHLASAVAACAACHGPNLAGKIEVDDPLLARIVAPNLTHGRGGVGATLTDADFVRAIRHGVDPTGRQLLSMPSDDYNNFSDADLGAIIAYVRSLPPINTSLPPNDIRTLGLILFALGPVTPCGPAAGIDRVAPDQPRRPPGSRLKYGLYLVDATRVPHLPRARTLGRPDPAGAAKWRPGGQHHPDRSWQLVRSRLHQGDAHRHPARWPRDRYRDAVAILPQRTEQRTARDLAAFCRPCRRAQQAPLRTVPRPRTTYPPGRTRSIAAPAQPRRSCASARGQSGRSCKQAPRRYQRPSQQGSQKAERPSRARRTSRLLEGGAAYYHRRA